MITSREPFETFTTIQKGRESIYQAIIDGMEVANEREGHSAYTDEMKYIENSSFRFIAWTCRGERVEVVEVELDGEVYDITVTRKRRLK